MVRRYVWHCDLRKLEAQTVTRGGTAKPTGNRRRPTLPGWSGWRLGKGLRTMEVARHARIRRESDVKVNREVTPNDPKLSDSGPGTRMGARRREAKARAVLGFMAGRTARD